MTFENADRPDLWIPDNPDGSGWADVDWVSAAKGSRYHYRHGDTLPQARERRPRFYQIVSRLETERIAPHENTYYVTGDDLADFLAELVWNGGAEVIWHIEPCDEPPPAARVTRSADGGI